MTAPTASVVPSIERMDFSAEEISALRTFVDSWRSHGGPVLFVGTGLSRFEAERKPGVPEEVKVADWPSLSRTLLLDVTGGDLSLDGTTPTDNLGIAQRHLDLKQRRRLIDLIEQEVPYKKFNPGKAHRALRPFPWAAIITTNYDDLLERTFDEAGERPGIKIVSDHDLTRARVQNAVCVYKMHGCFEHSDTIVLSEQDYESFEEKRPMLASRVRSLLFEHPTLFLGCSMTDPNVNGMIERVRNRAAPYIIRSVALVHTEPTAPERGMWFDRGVDLVYLRPGRRVVDFLQALRLTSQPTLPASDFKESPGVVELRRVLENRVKGWVEAACKNLRDIMTGGSDGDRRRAGNLVLVGDFHPLPIDETEAVLNQLNRKARREMLLVAHASGLVRGRRHGTRTIDIEALLLEDAELDKTDRAKVLAKRAEREERLGELASAKDDLIEARRLLAPTADEIELQLRRVLHRLGDEEAIESELLLGPLPTNGDSFACSRRAADILMIRGREPARRCYEQALDFARNGDEKTAALRGLQACAAPGEWPDIAELDPDWPAIRASKRPRVEKVLKLEEEAGEQLLNAYRKGEKTPGNETSAAVRHLELALREADDMGWPRSISPNFTGASDSLAYAMVGLLVREGAATAELKRGLELFVERGLLQPHGRLVKEALAGLLVTREDRGWLKQFCERRPEVGYKARTRKLLTSALALALPDEQIADHLNAVLKLDELKNKQLHETTATEIHLELLQPHYHCLPRAAASRLVGSFCEIFRNDELSFHRHSKWAWLPISDWAKTGTVDRGSAELTTLGDILVQGFRERNFASDAFVQRHALGLLDQLNDAGSLSDKLRDDLGVALDVEIQRCLEHHGDFLEVIHLIRFRQEVAPAPLPEPFLQRFPQEYQRIRRSTGAGSWLALVGSSGKQADPAARESLRESVEDYAAFTLSQRGDDRLLGPFPKWAALGICEAVESQLMTTEAARQVLLELCEVYPECLPDALQMQGADLPFVRNLERQLVKALSSCRADYGAALRWCINVPRGMLVSASLERLLLGQALAQDEQARQHAYWSLGWLGESVALSRTALEGLRETILDCGKDDPEWRPRAASVVAAAKATHGFGDAELATLISTAEADDIAGVRRAAGFLRLAVTQKARKD